MFIDDTFGDVAAIDIEHGGYLAWQPSKSIWDTYGDVTFAQILANGAPIKAYLSEAQRKEYLSLMSYAKANAKANKTTGVPCAIALALPSSIKQDLTKLKAEASMVVADTIDKPDNHDILAEASFLLSKMAKKELAIQDEKRKVGINPLGGRAGRMTLRKGSFPIYNLPKDKRWKVKPNRDLLVEFDFISFEPRVLYALAGAQPPSKDVHHAHALSLSCTREEAKRAFFGWLYGRSDASFDHPELLRFKRWVEARKYRDGILVNHHGRQFPCESRRKALSYFTQSTASDIFIERLVALSRALPTGADIMFTLHDSVLLDIDADVWHDVGGMVEVLSDTSIGRLPISVRSGSHWGDMERSDEV